MNINITDIRLPRIVLLSIAVAGISAAIGCGSSGPPQVSNRIMERCFGHESAADYVGYADTAMTVADVARQLQEQGEYDAVAVAAQEIRLVAEEAAEAADQVDERDQLGGFDRDDLRRSAHACRDIAEDYADYAERLAGQ